MTAVGEAWLTLALVLAGVVAAVWPGLMFRRPLLGRTHGKATRNPDATASPTVPGRRQPDWDRLLADADQVEGPVTGPERARIRGVLHGDPRPPPPGVGSFLFWDWARDRWPCAAVHESRV